MRRISGVEFIDDGVDHDGLLGDGQGAVGGDGDPVICPESVSRAEGKVEGRLGRTSFEGQRLTSHENNVRPFVAPLHDIVFLSRFAAASAAAGLMRTL